MAHFELIEKMAPNAVIKVIGVGGGGGNAVAHMVSTSVDGVEFITANTDSQAIKNCGAKLQLQLGTNVTKGLGAGANPEVGRQAALEDRERARAARRRLELVLREVGVARVQEPPVARADRHAGVAHRVAVQRDQQHGGLAVVQRAHALEAVPALAAGVV